MTIKPSRIVAAIGGKVMKTNGLYVDRPLRGNPPAFAPTLGRSVSVYLDYLARWN